MQEVLELSRFWKRVSHLQKPLKGFLVDAYFLILISSYMTRRTTLWLDSWVDVTSCKRFFLLVGMLFQLMPPSLLTVSPASPWQNSRGFGMTCWPREWRQRQEAARGELMWFPQLFSLSLSPRPAFPSQSERSSVADHMLGPKQVTHCAFTQEAAWMI